MVALAPHLSSLHRDTRRASAAWLIDNGFLESGMGWNLFYRPLIDHRGQPATMWVGAGTIAICDVVAIYEQTTGMIWDNGKESNGG